jgi:hypothetical protein
MHKTQFGRKKTDTNSDYLYDKSCKSHDFTVRSLLIATLSQVIVKRFGNLVV